jgi:hypothetical protein
MNRVDLFGRQRAVIPGDDSRAASNRPVELVVGQFAFAQSRQH